jgi:hypothetical protein
VVPVPVIVLTTSNADTKVKRLLLVPVGDDVIISVLIIVFDSDDVTMQVDDVVIIMLIKDKMRSRLMMNLLGAFEE